MKKQVISYCMLLGSLSFFGTAQANTFQTTESEDTTRTIKGGNAWAGAFQPSNDWQPPRDAKALEKLAKFQNLKFGIMFNWGTQTLFQTVDQSWSLCPERMGWNKRAEPYNEDTDWFAYKKAYEDLMKQFNPTDFNPQEQVKMMKRWGAKYVVVDAKHHDGFCLFDTKATGYRVTADACPYSTNKNADIMKVMLDNARNQGLWTGIYFSKADWNVPYYWAPQFGKPTSRRENYDRKKYPDVWERFAQFTRDQLHELTSNYGNIDILWLDGGQVNGKSFNLEEVAKDARLRNPGMLVVDRCNGGGNEDYITPEGVHQMPAKYTPIAWEACMSLGSKGWAWNKNSEYKSAKSIVRYLVKAVARNGNLLVGIGPDYKGVIAPRAVEVFDSVGNWLSLNGEAIYNSRPIAPYEMGNVFFTQKTNGDVFAIVLTDRENDKAPSKITIPASFLVGNRIVTAIGSDKKIGVGKIEKNNVTLALPKSFTSVRSGAWVLKIASK